MEVVKDGEETPKNNELATENQLRYLAKCGVPVDEKTLTAEEAIKLIDATPANDIQKNFLKENNIDFKEDITVGHASYLISGVMENQKAENAKIAEQEDVKHYVQGNIPFHIKVDKGNKMSLQFFNNSEQSMACAFSMVQNHLGNIKEGFAKDPAFKRQFSQEQQTSIVRGFYLISKCMQETMNIVFTDLEKAKNKPKEEPKKDS